VIKRLSSMLLCGSIFLVACSKRERSTADDAEWADIQPVADNTSTANVPASAQSQGIIQSEGEDYSLLAQRLEEMQHVERASGETMITGENLVFDYERRFVRMDQQVKVVDDHGLLEAETLLGRFSESNTVEMIEARKDVRITSEGRVATAESAIYAFQSGSINLAGSAQLTETGHRLSGDRITFWIKGSRRMVCEPNARLEITGTSGMKIEGLAGGDGTTEIFSDRLVYDEEQALAEFDGNVRLRDPRAAMDCGKIRLYLKENNEIDWIEARTEVIIQIDGRKALADHASYYAAEKKFVLEGDPKVKEGRNIMSGDRVFFWVEPERVVFDGNAHMIFQPDEATRARFMKDLKD